jgi:creatinine amidohydrolase
MNPDLHSLTLPDARAITPTLAVLPWGATEAHGPHLPHGTDVIEASAIAREAAVRARQRGGPIVLLPCIPFGNNEQQLDQVATISFRTDTQRAILFDVVRSLKHQGVRRLLVVNGHGGNEFKPLVRDAIGLFGTFIGLVNFWSLAPYPFDPRATPQGDHANEMETSLVLHITPELVKMPLASTGPRVPFRVDALNQPGVWTPRPWSQSHPDTTSGDARFATPDKGRAFFDACVSKLSGIIHDLAMAPDADVPHLAR